MGLFKIKHVGASLMHMVGKKVKGIPFFMVDKAIPHPEVLPLAGIVHCQG